MVCVSAHNGSTLKVAKAIAKVLDAKLIKPSEFKHENLDEYEAIGFGSGIYDNTLHNSVLGVADSTQTFEGKRVFVFSTAGVLWQDAHAEIRAKLFAKNAEIVGEFRCKGFNTNSFLKYIGGMNKGRPNADDIAQAKSFASGLMN